MTQIPKRDDRIRLVARKGDPDPIHVGQVGTVVGVRRHGRGDDEWFPIDVSWDNGRTLTLVSPTDAFEITADGK